VAHHTVDEILDQSITAYKAADMERASKLLAEAIKLEANNERAWLWLSGIVVTDGERLFCMKRLLAINPLNEIAQHGLAILPRDAKPVQPSLDKAKKANVEICTFPGCDQPVSRIGFKFCYKHWKAVNAPLEPNASLNATALGEKFKLSTQRMNLVLAELGWIAKDRKGWIPTQQGKALGAVQKEHNQTGVPFVVWPEAVSANKALVSTVQSLRGEVDQGNRDSASGGNGFREKFPASHRATDGHWVRSRAEMLIDNWLHVSGIAHAYERKLPIEEDVYSDFYVPEGKVYIEYWGLQNDAKYAARKKAKLEVYRKHGLNLVELTDEHIKNIDDHLPKLLLKFGVATS
jgi:hypothetical protein